MAYMQLIKGFCILAEHVCSIVASLFRNLVGSQRQRLVQKFVEDDHIKIDRLMELHFKYYKKIQDCDARIEREKEVGSLHFSCSKALIINRV